MSFSAIIQSPTIRSMVQENLLAKQLEIALFPATIFRGDVEDILWNANEGDNRVFTSPGLIKPKMRPLANGVDPAPSTWNAEQWDVTAQLFGDTIDSSSVTDALALANLLLTNTDRLGRSAAQALNRIVRNRMYNAAISGQTVADGAQGPVNTIRVKRLNGFTRARNPNLSTGSAVRFDGISSSNPLSVQIMTSAGSLVTRNVTAYSPDNTGDEIGPGTITVDGAAVTVDDRGYIRAVDASFIVRVGGGAKVDTIDASSLLKLQDIRLATSRLTSQNVPHHPDGMFHGHIDPTSQSQIFSDTEFQRLFTASKGESPVYQNYELGSIMGSTIFQNTEAPYAGTVDDGGSATWSLEDNFAGELYSNGTTTGTVIHRPIFTGLEVCKEYWLDTQGLVSEAGVSGKISNFGGRIEENGIQIMADRIALLIRGPIDRMFDKIACSWKFVGDWAVRTDACTGDRARFKRAVAIEHGE